MESTLLEDTDDNGLSPGCRETCGKIRRNEICKLQISPFYFPNKAADLDALGKALLVDKDNCSVSELKVNYPGMDEMSLSNSLSRVFVESRGLKEVKLEGWNIGTLAMSVVRSRSIKHLEIANCHLDPSVLAQLLSLPEGGCETLTLKTWDLYSEDDLGTIASACLENKWIKTLLLENRFGTCPLLSTLVHNLSQSMTSLECKYWLDGYAVAGLLRESKCLNRLVINTELPTRDDFLTIKRGLAQNSSLRELELSFAFESMDSEMDVLVGDMVEAATGLEHLAICTETTPSHLQSVFVRLADHSRIHRIRLSCKWSPGVGKTLATFLQRHQRFEDSIISITDEITGYSGSTRLLQTNQALLELSFHEFERHDELSFVEDFICTELAKCSTLKNLDLRVETRYLQRKTLDCLARYMETNKVLRALELHLTRVALDFLGRMIGALVTSESLKEFIVRSSALRMGSAQISELVKVLPRLRNLRKLHIENAGQLDPASKEDVLREMDLNLSLTDISILRDRNAVDVARKAAERNKALISVDYGLEAPPCLWPNIIHTSLRNVHVGPSIVCRLLSSRSVEVASRVPVRKVRRIGDFEDGKGTQKQRLEGC